MCEIQRARSIVAPYVVGLELGGLLALPSLFSHLWSPLHIFMADWLLIYSITIGAISIKELLFKVCSTCGPLLSMDK